MTTPLAYPTGPLTVDDMAALGYQFLCALATAHALGHQDLNGLKIYCEPDTWAGRLVLEAVERLDTNTPMHQMLKDTGLMRHIVEKVAA